MDRVVHIAVGQIFGMEVRLRNQKRLQLGGCRVRSHAALHLCKASHLGDSLTRTASQY